MFSACWLEKHGNATLEDKWTITEVDGPLPHQVERSVEDHRNKDQDEGECGALTSLFNFGRYLKLPRGEAFCKTEDAWLGAYFNYPGAWWNALETSMTSLQLAQYGEVAALASLRFAVRLFLLSVC